ncbi:hypothetical protein [Polyangium aurulentum]|uniref:hypothetical protein n=1 Tax=Polyangium aurulentum TaxID=2567896 RepID=UPI0010ADC22C|nr:hypothetical protein [Polyangium aurulentum]UQA56080.1 hypothetical protein E8A73_032835 [Polyangium aurulentum]
MTKPAAVRIPCAQGVCDGALQCVECVEAVDCGDASPCNPWSCQAGSCVRTPAPMGPAAVQEPGDCTERQCDGKGGETQILREDDLPMGPCRVGACTNGAPKVFMDPAGTPCTEDGGNVCDGAGHCVECTGNKGCGSDPWRCDEATHTCFNCANGIKDGDESDIDCGTTCPRCTQGRTCKADSDCNGTPCVDGICCETACDTVCFACDLPGSVGKCEPIPEDGEDTSFGDGQDCLHTESFTCTGLGTCRKMSGAACFNDTECASVNCMNGACAP